MNQDEIREKISALLLTDLQGSHTTGYIADQIHALYQPLIDQARQPAYAIMLQAVKDAIQEGKQLGRREALANILLSLDMAEDENGFVSISNHYPWSDLISKFPSSFPTEK